ncbi:DUF2163 domain-containing protein [Paracoccus jiaweipingae]|uniref:DUF2163 domain-containing protein n=1 Tax=unclassified Paracoccus (in: a-proteobacteria) TaxID=2688777 RepID=UPI0037A0C0D9
MTTLARAWAVTRRDGFALGFTDHDTVLTFDGMAFRPDSGLTAKAVVQGAGLSVDNSEAEGALSDAAITETDLMAGRWDEAEVRLWEVDWRDTANRREVFRGHLGEVTRSGAAFRAELRGLSERLNQPSGRVYHPLCSARLGDAACGVDLAAPGLWAEAEVVEGTGSEALLLSGIDGFAPRWFERGVMKVVQGAAAGLSALIKNDRVPEAGRRALVLWDAPAIALQPGDRVRLVAGCDKRGGTCRLKFDNYLNFRGFPHLPAEDWLMAPQVTRVKRGVVRDAIRDEIFGHGSDR